MKKTVKIALSVALCALMLAMLAPTAAWASQQNGMDFYGSGGTPVWSFTSDVKVYGDAHDFFGSDAKELSPGDTMAKRVQLRNYSSNSAVFGMKMTPVSQGRSDALASSGNYGSKTGMELLLSKIEATVTCDADGTSVEIYKGPLSGNGTGAFSSGGIALGTIDPQRYGDVQVQLDIPYDLGNEFANALCAVEWVFLVEELEEAPTLTPTPTPEPTPTASPEPTPTSAPYTPPLYPDPQESSGANPTQPPAPTPTAEPEATPTEEPETPEEPETETPPESTSPPVVDTGSVEDLPPPDKRGETTGSSGSTGSSTNAGTESNSSDLTVVTGEVGSPLPQTAGLITYSLPAAIGFCIFSFLFTLTFIKRKRRS